MISIPHRAFIIAQILYKGVNPHSTGKFELLITSRKKSGSTQKKKSNPKHIPI